MTNQLRKDLMTARDSRIATNKPASARLSTAIERLNRGDLRGAHDWVQAAHQCDKDNGYIHSHHSGKRWAYVPCIGLENHHQ